MKIDLLGDLFMKIGFQGETGAYSEDAAIQFFKDKKIELVSFYRLEDVFKAVINKKVDFGIIPVENSTYGFVLLAWDLLRIYNVRIYAETILRIVHCLIALPGAKLSNIRYIYSHPQALGQCKAFLNKLHDVEIIPAYDIAGSIMLIKREYLYNVATIASKRAARAYKMEILAEGIDSSKNNYMRFFIIGLKDRGPTGNDKTTIIFSTLHKPGALYNALRSFAENKVNITAIMSRPITDRPWEYYFFMDIEGHHKEEKVQNAIVGLSKHSTFVKVVGSYPKAYTSYV